RDIEADRETRGWRYDNSLCPVSIKEKTVHQMVSSIKATEQSLLAQGKSLQYEMCYKRKKDRIQSISFTQNRSNLTLVKWTDIKNGTEKKKLGFKLPLQDFPGVIEIYSEHEFRRIQDILSDPDSGHSPDKVTRMLTIKWEQPNHFYVCFPFTNIIKQQPTPTQKYIVAMDPGVRTFQTLYDLQGSFTEVGKGDFQKLTTICLNLDKLISKASKFR
ncbi:hypothetical protein MP638_006813, partial [Amoeboaphelidium occidentale]